MTGTGPGSGTGSGGIAWMTRSLGDSMFLVRSGSADGQASFQWVWNGVDGTWDRSHIPINSSGFGSSWSMLPDGGIVTAGSVDHGYPTYNDFVVSRYTALGLPDETFAPGGAVSKDFGAAGDFASVAVRSDGRILVAGVPTVASGSVNAEREARSRRATTTSPVVFRLRGGSLTGLATKLTKSPTASLVTLRLKSGRANWKTSAALRCNGCSGRGRQAAPDAKPERSRMV